METIAEINDMACHSIELGHYQTALDALNCCLGCVKHLKKHRAMTMDEDPACEKQHSNNIVDGQRRSTKEIVARLLKGAKRKLANRTSNAKITTIIENDNKRKVPSASSSVVVPQRPRKRRRHPTQGELPPNPSHVDEANACSFSVPSGCQASVDISSSSNNDKSVFNESSDHQPLECNEEHFFIYRKPLRLTKFQRSRIAECKCLQAQEGEKKNQNNIHREVELAVSSNLIFNIALAHHLIVTSNGTEKSHSSSSSCSRWRNPNDGDYTDDEEDDDENGCGYDSSSCEESATSQSNILRKQQRLKGALRLYELGFRVHTKRVAYVASSQLNILGSPPTSLYPVSSSHSSLTTVIPVRQTSSSSSIIEERRSRSQAGPLASIASASTSQNDREEELKSTTRFALALLNNCAHIHEALGHTEKAEIFQKRLLSFLLVIVDSGESIHDIVGDDPAVDGYLKNVFNGTIFNKDTAPAAVA